MIIKRDSQAGLPVGCGQGEAGDLSGAGVGWIRGGGLTEGAEQIDPGQLLSWLECRPTPMLRVRTPIRAQTRNNP